MCDSLTKNQNFPHFFELDGNFKVIQQKQNTLFLWVVKFGKIFCRPKLKYINFRNYTKTRSQIEFLLWMKSKTISWKSNLSTWVIRRKEFLYVLRENISSPVVTWWWNSIWTYLEKKRNNKLVVYKRGIRQRKILRI